MKKAIVRRIDDTKTGLCDFKKEITDTDEFELIQDYPTVYIHNWENTNKYEVYVGESNDFFQRTQQHFDREDIEGVWQNNLKTNEASLYVIAHPEFNKSLTLDIENKLIHFLSSSSSVCKVHNSRGNPQNKYYPCEDFDQIFASVWKELRKYNKELFLSESEIKDSAIYKASPLHKLTLEQTMAKEKILNKILECIAENKNHQMVLVKGNAGTGKTVLMSSMFYEILTNQDNLYNDLDCAILVNHNEQLTVYEEIGSAKWKKTNCL